MFFRKKADKQEPPKGIRPAYMVHPLVIERSEFAQILVQKGSFNVEDYANVLFLPADIELSRKMWWRCTLIFA